MTSVYTYNVDSTTPPWMMARILRELIATVNENAGSGGGGGGGSITGTGGTPITTLSQLLNDPLTKSSLKRAPSTGSVLTALTGTLSAGVINRVDCSAGNAIYTLPDAAVAGAGASVIARKYDSGGNTLTVKPTGSAPTLVGAGTQGVNGVTLPSGIQANDLIVLIFVSYQATLAQPAGYTILEEVGGSTAGGGQANVFYKYAVGNESGTTVPGQANGVAAAYVVLRGVDLSTPFDSSMPFAETGYVTAHTPPSITTSSLCYVIQADCTTTNTVGKTATGSPIVSNAASDHALTVWGAAQSGAGTTAPLGTATFTAVKAGTTIALGVRASSVVNSLDGQTGGAAGRKLKTNKETEEYISDGTTGWLTLNSNPNIDVLDNRYDASGAASAVQTSLGSAVAAAASGGKKYRTPWKQPFQVNSIWNLPLAVGAEYQAPTGSQTVQMRRTDLTAWCNYNQYTMPINLAKDTDPLASLTDSNYAQNTIPNPPGIRIPIDVNISPGGDRNCCVIEPSQRFAHEMFYMTKQSDTAYTTARHIPVDLYGSGIGPLGGVRAAGVSHTGGLIRKWETDPTDPDYTGEINHALGIAVGSSQLYFSGGSSGYFLGYGTMNGYVWPATEQDYDSPGTYTTDPTRIRMGSLFAIPPWIDITALGLTAPGLVIARTLQKYGAYVVDRSSGVTFYAEPTVSFSGFIGGVLTDVRTLVNNLVMVLNSTRNTPGGGAWLGDASNRVAPLALPLPPIPKGS